MKIFSYSKQELFNAFKKEFIPQNEKESQEAFIIVVSSLSLYLLVLTIVHFETGENWKAKKQQEKETQQQEKIQKVATSCGIIEKKQSLCDVLTTGFKAFNDKIPKSKGEEEKILASLEKTKGELLTAIEIYTDDLQAFDRELQDFKKGMCPQDLLDHHLEPNQGYILQGVIPPLLHFILYSTTLDWEKAKNALEKLSTGTVTDFPALEEGRAFQKAIKNIGYVDMPYLKKLYEFLFNEDPPQTEGKGDYGKICQKFARFFPNLSHFLTVQSCLFHRRVKTENNSSGKYSIKCSQLWGLDKKDCEIFFSSFEATHPAIDPLENAGNYQKALEFVSKNWPEDETRP